MRNPEKEERRAYLRLILFMIRRMSMPRLRQTLEAVKEIYEEKPGKRMDNACTPW